MNLPVYTREGGDAGRTVTLDESVFGVEPSDHAIWLDVRAAQAHARQGTHKTKERGEVRGSTRKLYRQKGTGNARHGAKSAPIFVGGGRAHPPKPQDFSWRPPRKVRLGALKGALSLLVKEGRLTVVDSIELDEIKTKALLSVLNTLQAPSKVLVVDDKSNEKLRLSIRNVEGKQFLPPEGVNVYDLLRHEHLVLSKQAVKAIEARCGGGEA